MKPLLRPCRGLAAYNTSVHLGPSGEVLGKCGLTWRGRWEIAALGGSYKPWGRASQSAIFSPSSFMGSFYLLWPCPQRPCYPAPCSQTSPLSALLPFPHRQILSQRDIPGLFQRWGVSHTPYSHAQITADVGSWLNG